MRGYGSCAGVMWFAMQRELTSVEVRHPKLGLCCGCEPMGITVIGSGCKLI